MTVQQILDAKGSTVFTVDPDEAIHLALRMFRSHKIGALVVTDADGRLLGTLTERDVVNGLLTWGRRLLDRRVEEAMDTAVPTCSPRDSVAWVMQTMTDQRTRHLPVIEGGVVAGLISIGDVVKARLGDIELENKVLRDIARARS
jgi:CBS domain-containing protein